MSSSDTGLEAALAFVGVSLGEGDIDVIRAVAQAFEPAMAALDAADVAELPLESDLDPGRPPSGGPADG